MGGWRQRVAALLPAELVRFDELMANHTSFRIGGPADLFLAPRSYDDLLRCLELVKANGLACFLLGGGTNILVLVEFPLFQLQKGSVQCSFESALVTLQRRCLPCSYCSLLDAGRATPFHQFRSAESSR